MSFSNYSFVDNVYFIHGVTSTCANWIMNQESFWKYKTCKDKHKEFNKLLKEYQMIQLLLGKPDTSTPLADSNKIPSFIRRHKMLPFLS